MILQQGAGRLYIASERSPEPGDLTNPWPDVWEFLGETKGGVEFASDPAISLQFAMESYAPIGYETGDTVTTVSFGLASVTAQNISFALSGSSIRVDPTTTKFVPSSANAYFNLGWESDEGSERWVYRRCRPTAALSVVRSKTDAAVVPVTFTMFADHSNRPLWQALTKG